MTKFRLHTLTLPDRISALSALCAGVPVREAVEHKRAVEWQSQTLQETVGGSSRASLIREAVERSETEGFMPPVTTGDLK